MDETGLFYRDTSRQTLFIKGQDCAGGKRSKERITVALCASMTGEKLKPLLIGKSRQPRCFSKIKPESLPVIYKFNSKAWMNSYVMEEWLKQLDSSMRRQKRKILLFLDNAPSHPNIKLSNVELQFLPPNTTYKTQPMDMGIIQAMKLKFRKRQMKHMIKEMDKHPDICGTDILKQITILDAIYWVHSAWEEVQTSTIQKCFSKAGFLCENIDSDDDFDDDDDVPLSVLKLAHEVFGCEFNDLSEMDQTLSTCDNSAKDWDRPATDLLNTLESDGSESESDSDNKETNCCSVSDAHIYADKLKEFAQFHGNTRLLSSLMSASEYLNDMSLNSSKQKPITDFF
ncbi:tigger transposable element-derived protein 4-like [Saccostrea cucullata]|uniref:tigger transposable element-derived protein 4-like n=1 Tax=Saccostrea cuccullata TaxID=36930 RepID=UPI002ED68301